MSLNADMSKALQILKNMQERVEKSGNAELKMNTAKHFKTLISVLEDPVFRGICRIQDSATDLNRQLKHNPSIGPHDFDINISGQLELKVPSTSVQPLGPNQDLYQGSSELEDQRVSVAPLLHSSSEDTSAQKVTEAAAKGRQIFTVQLYKSEGTSLGFGVIRLRSKDKTEFGIFVQEIQPNGIAGCNGRLLEGDQILAIDGQPLDSNISDEQATSILQKARGLVKLDIARST
ncbi:patj homolog [Temnothorax nylanderi]|uniref:patj homolog n=1 Tax=Temnothorax nylanderi TaxID=102681 RepID=UPI003A8A6D64